MSYDPLKIEPSYIGWDAYYDPEGPIGRGKTPQDALYELIVHCLDDDHQERLLTGSIVAALAKDAVSKGLKEVEPTSVSPTVSGTREPVPTAGSTPASVHPISPPSRDTGWMALTEGKRPVQGERVWIAGYGSKGRFYAEAVYRSGEWLMFDQEVDAHIHPCEYPAYWCRIEPIPEPPQQGGSV